nr:hypothetical protein [Bacteroidota bacterium]
MPQITLEYSSNLEGEPKSTFEKFFSELHNLLTETLGIDPLNCKSRWISRNDYYIANGDYRHAFAHLEIKTLNRHDPAKLKIVGHSALELLREFYNESSAGKWFQPSVVITEMNREYYFKIPTGEIKGGE